MAWPRDARHTVFGALQQILDSFLNELQDQIISFNEERKRIFTHFYADDTGSGAIGLSRETTATNGEYTLAATSDSDIAFCDCPGNVGDVINEVKVKVYNSTAATDLTAELFVGDHEFDVPATDPGAATQLATAATAASIAFQVLTLTPASPRTLAADESIWVKISGLNGVAGDRLFATQVAYLPVII